MRCQLALSGALAGLLAQVATATTCTPDNATPVESLVSSGGGGSGGGGADIFVSYNPFDVISNAVKKRTTPDARLGNMANILVVSRRDSASSVTCAATEMCLSIQKYPFCLDLTNGDFHDGTGITGNALSGDYTLADGRKGNLYNGPYPQPTGAGGASAPATTAAAASAAGGAGSGDGGDAAESATASPGTGTGAAAGASPTSTGNSGPAATGILPGKNDAAPRAVGVAVFGSAMAVLGAVLLL
ncbi:uncharacterized protein B0T15DRAFT_504291 [Chaetomium strumarium]|uniref:Uncharacterized protein n=1 Tax=Chaetomium strumarium TaxID=1170767 RepID=A0AAJ0GN39_9PEZI|nr:hypothetical protein B0T15DRAFT_504291 [Chaetomium strumarium]